MMPAPLRIAQIGYGHWGTNLARASARTTGCALVAIADLDETNRARAVADHPDAASIADPAHLLASPLIDAVSIATPAGTHPALVAQALAAGKHVLVTKPLAADAAVAHALGQEASRRGLVLLVDHTFVFSPAVVAIADIVAGGSLGRIAYVESQRAGLGIFKDDVTVIEDLAIHDFAILDRLLGRMPARVSATWTRTHDGLMPSAAWIALAYDDGLAVHLAAHWFAPVKRRLMVIAGAKKMLTWDDTLPGERVRVHDAGTDPAATVVPGRAPLAYRNHGAVVVPVADDEPLALEFAHFRDAVAGRCAPRADAGAAARVATLCAAASASATAGGQPVDVS
jgi:predicted dehydrogenase